MRVLQVNSVCGYGSTGRATTELASKLIEQGHECFIAYGQGTTTYANSFKFSGTVENHFHNLGSRLLGNQGCYSTTGTQNLVRYIDKLEPDVIHLHNLHGHYLNLEILFAYLSRIDLPVVWTLHDCWAFTGKCAHFTAVNCDRWQTQCHHCPQLSEYPPSLLFDRSTEQFCDKRKWFNSVNRMTIVSVSNWLAQQVKKSFLSGYPVLTCYNWIDQGTFRPTLSDLRERLGIGENTFVILGVSASWQSGSRKWIDFLRLSRLLGADMTLVLIGGTSRPVDLPDCVIWIPYVSSPNELAKYYSMADVFVHLSVEDTFGKVIAEALACGTPAIVYESTGCPEVVGTGCGFKVAPRDTEAIFAAIQDVKQRGKHLFSQDCIDFVSTNFDYVRNINWHLALYGRLISQ